MSLPTKSRETHVAPARLAQVDRDGFAGEFYLPRSEQGVASCVIVVAGSMGGLVHRNLAQALAAQGIPALAVAYFNYAGLPSKLQRIALEYFERPIAWLRSQAESRNLQLAILGRSRGAELALQLASVYDDFKSVIAISPSHVRWGAPGGRAGAWTHAGRDLPFVQSRTEPAPQPSPTKHDGVDFFPLRAHFEHDLADNPSLPEAVIPVERIAGDLLLFAGQDDQLWPSDVSADEIERRARSHGFAHELHNVQYPNVGHDFPLPGTTPIIYARSPGAPSGVLYGGKADIQHAVTDYWQRLIGSVRGR
jgi:dienelactone hydrolase